MSCFGHQHIPFLFTSDTQSITENNLLHPKTNQEPVNIDMMLPKFGISSFSGNIATYLSHLKLPTYWPGAQLTTGWPKPKRFRQNVQFFFSPWVLSPSTSIFIISHARRSWLGNRVSHLQSLATYRPHRSYSRWRPPSLWTFSVAATCCPGDGWWSAAIAPWFLGCKIAASPALVSIAWSRLQYFFFLFRLAWNLHAHGGCSVHCQVCRWPVSSNSVC